MTTEVKRMGVPVQPAALSVDSFIEQTAQQGGTTISVGGSSSFKGLPTQSINGLSGVFLLEALESKLETYEQQLVELNKYSTKLREEYSHKVNATVLKVLFLLLTSLFALLQFRWNTTIYLLNPASFLVRQQIWSDRTQPTALTATVTMSTKLDSRWLR